MDITDLIMSDHHEQRRVFALVDEIGPGPDRLRPVRGGHNGIRETSPAGCLQRRQPSR